MTRTSLILALGATLLAGVAHADSIPNQHNAPSALAEDYCHRLDEARLGTHGCYENKDRILVHRPAPSDVIPDGPTARCRDGDFSFSRHHTGTCSSHGGVAAWLR
jgi:Protein of unknown function (DUF3761)